MAMNKASNLYPYQNIPTQAVSGNVTSSATNVFSKDNVVIQLLWDGTLAGSFDVQVSVDYSKDTGVGTWDSLPFSPTPAATGSPGHWTIDLNQLGSVYIQVVFTYVSGAGNLTSTIAGKGI